MMPMKSSNMGKISFGLAVLPLIFVMVALLFTALQIPGFG